jgi:hypothetical protein
LLVCGDRVFSSGRFLGPNPDIEPGDQPSYELCKTIWAAHPLGAKMVEAPIAMAQSQEREISVPDSPEEMVRDAFQREWKAIGADDARRQRESVHRKDWAIEPVIPAPSTYFS